MSSSHDSAPLPEPTTPLWLPALGGALFIAAGIAWAICPASASAPTASGAAPAASSTAFGNMAEPMTPEIARARAQLEAAKAAAARQNAPSPH